MNAIKNLDHNIPFPACQRHDFCWEARVCLKVPRSAVSNVFPYFVGSKKAAIALLCDGLSDAFGGTVLDIDNAYPDRHFAGVNDKTKTNVQKIIADRSLLIRRISQQFGVVPSQSSYIWFFDQAPDKSQIRFMIYVCLADLGQAEWFIDNLLENSFLKRFVTEIHLSGDVPDDITFLCRSSVNPKCLTDGIRTKKNNITRGHVFFWRWHQNDSKKLIFAHTIVLMLTLGLCFFVSLLLKLKSTTLMGGAFTSWVVSAITHYIIIKFYSQRNPEFSA